MARTVLAVQPTVREGLAASYTTATVDGHAFSNAGRNVFLHVKNAGGVSTTVTIVTPGTVDGLAIPDRTVSIPAGADRFIGPFPKTYEQVDSLLDINEAVYVNAAPQASVSYAAIKLGSL